MQRRHGQRNRRLPIVVEGYSDATELVNKILSTSGGAQISNAFLVGDTNCAGVFSGGLSIGGLALPDLPDSGVILSSGTPSNIIGPNVLDGITTDNGEAGDPDLDGLIPGYNTYDACVLEFDFTCPSELVGDQDVTFNYVFASDEYNEFVNTQFNDVFGFFLNDINIALLPDGSGTPVAINNVNNGNPFGVDASNPGLYINNDLSDGGGAIDLEADGLTVPLTAAATTLPGTNHMKLAIADAGDYILDSWVLLESGSFGCTTQNCVEFKGCHKNNEDKRAICHRQGRAHNTLCLPAEAIAAHLAQHDDDTCGCCSVEEEKRRPAFCDQWD